MVETDDVCVPHPLRAYPIPNNSRSPAAGVGERGLTAASISVRLVRGMLRSIGCSLTFLVLFVGHVMADGAEWMQSHPSKR